MKNSLTTWWFLKMRSMFTFARAWRWVAGVHSIQFIATRARDMPLRAQSMGLVVHYHDTTYHTLPWRTISQPTTAYWLILSTGSPSISYKPPEQMLYKSSDSHLFKLCLIPLAKNQCDICILISHRIFVFLSVFALRAIFISGHARQIGGTSTAGAMLDSGYLTCLVPFSIGPRRRHRHHHQHHHHN